MVFIDGGDAGSNSNTEKLFNLSALYKPSIILMGGDVAYDNGLLSCYHTWDKILDALENHY